LGVEELGSSIGLLAEAGEREKRRALERAGRSGVKYDGQDSNIGGN
jgi:hypothetical protein